RGSLEHGASPRSSDDAALLRRSGRLLLSSANRLWLRSAPLRSAELYHAISAGEEGSIGCSLRAGEADRVLRGSGDTKEMGAVCEGGNRGMAACVRGSRIQERDRRERSAESGG